MTLSDMIIAAVKASGGDGLCNASVGCGCSLDDIAPREFLDIQWCVAAKSRVLESGEYLGDCGPGDLWFTEVVV